MTTTPLTLRISGSGAFEPDAIDSLQLAGSESLPIVRGLREVGDIREGKDGTAEVMRGHCISIELGR